MVNDDRFEIDKRKLEEISLRAYVAYDSGKGVFRRKRTLLPQWNLPLELEYDPQRVQTRDSEKAGNYLWVLASLEKRSQSRVNIRNGLKAWGNPEIKWVFYPKQVIEKSPENLREAIEQGFQYGLNGFQENFFYNAEKIVREYGGYARNVIQDQTVEEARRRLQEFKGIGTGIANLFIIYCTEREIARIQDPEKIKLKIDIHKARIPANTDAIIPLNGSLMRGALVRPLEEAYLEVCQKYGLNGGKLDSALWIIGSEICAKKDFGACSNFCPLNDVCTSLVTEDPNTRRIVVYNEEDNRIEMRNFNRVQTCLDI